MIPDSEAVRKERKKTPRGGFHLAASTGPSATIFPAPLLFLSPFVFFRQFQFGCQVEPDAHKGRGRNTFLAPLRGGCKFPAQATRTEIIVMSRLNHPFALLLARAVGLFVAWLALVKLAQYILRNPFSA